MIISAILSPVFINKEKINWDAILTDKIEATQINIDRALDRKSELLIRSFESIRPDLTKILSYTNVDNKKIIQLFSNYELATLNLSFDNTKIVGGDLSQQDIVGVWIVNIDGTGAKGLR